MNAFLGKAGTLVRERFGGKISYASIPFVGVDWTPFDFVSFDAYRSKEVADRDDALQSGMEEGVNDSHERLAELLETMSQ